MKKMHIALIGVAVLAAAFFIARGAYQSQRAEEIATLTTKLGPPLLRDYSVSMGAADAKVVIVDGSDLLVTSAWSAVHGARSGRVYILSAGD